MAATEANAEREEPEVDSVASFVPPDRLGSGEYPSLVNLLLGAALEAGDVLLRPVREWETSETAGPEDEADADRARYALAGLLLDASETATRAVSTAAQVAGAIVRLGASAFQAVAPESLVEAGQRRFEAWVARGENEVERWVRIGRREEPRSRELARHVFTRTVDDTVSMLSRNPGVEALIRVRVDSYIAYLHEHPERVEPLVRQLGDGYIDYLHEHPEQVQDLIQSQSVSLGTEIVDGVRERTVTADSFFETLIRSLLRREPRAELPEPSPEVKQWAEQARLRPPR
jgi:hypothetical protein